MSAGTSGKRARKRTKTSCTRSSAACGSRVSCRQRRRSPGACISYSSSSCARAHARTGARRTLLDGRHATNVPVPPDLNPRMPGLTRPSHVSRSHPSGFRTFRVVPGAGADTRPTKELDDDKRDDDAHARPNARVRRARPHRDRLRPCQRRPHADPDRDRRGRRLGRLRAGSCSRRRGPIDVSATWRATVADQVRDSDLPQQHADHLVAPFSAVGLHALLIVEASSSEQMPRRAHAIVQPLLDAGGILLDRALARAGARPRRAPRRASLPARERARRAHDRRPRARRGIALARGDGTVPRPRPISPAPAGRPGGSCAPPASSISRASAASRAMTASCPATSIYQVAIPVPSTSGAILVEVRAGGEELDTRSLATAIALIRESELAPPCVSSAVPSTRTHTCGDAAPAAPAEASTRSAFRLDGSTPHVLSWEDATSTVPSVQLEVRLADEHGRDAAHAERARRPARGGERLHGCRDRAAAREGDADRQDPALPDPAQAARGQHRAGRLHRDGAGAARRATAARLPRQPSRAHGGLSEADAAVVRRHEPVS